MIREILKGTVAGAVGTVALNVTTYADMAIRGRPSSSAPAQMVSTLARLLGLSSPSQEGSSQDQTTQNRESGLGALLGYGLLRAQRDSVPIPLASIGVGLAAMAASDVPLIALRVSDPKTWGLSGWLADVIPHLIYGLVTVTTYEVLRNMD
jgi:hypothetical protein